MSALLAPLTRFERNVARLGAAMLAASCLMPVCAALLP